MVDSLQVAVRPDVSPRTLLDRSWPSEQTVLGWLGQAGFLVRSGEWRLMIDPYLSDSLAAKYRGQPLPHTRLMPPPIASEEVRGMDWVLCTHAHTDHMDPDTLSVLAANNPECRFVVPRAALETAAERGVPPTRTVTLDAGEEMELAAGLVVRAVASAHEELQRDEQGNYRCLGYVIRLRATTLYHAGDCVPYPDLAAELSRQRIHVAMLPVNGRDEFRRSHGIPGNFTCDEAIALCREADVPCMIACHHGMFDFNTVDPQWLDRRIAETPTPRCIRAKIGEAYELN